MNILFVDDETDLLDGIINEINFDQLGITGVYTADNAVQAKRILQTIPVDILVTDIEMPNVSGIELLEWATSNGLALITIFCTAYSDFNYAKKAIDLKVFDYFLKPFFYKDLQQKIANAVREAKKRDEENQLREDGAHWRLHRAETKNYFWRGINDCFYSPSENTVRKLETEYRIHYEPEDRFCVAAIDCYGAQIAEKRTLLRTLRASWEQISPDIALEGIFTQESGIIFLVFKADPAFNRFPDALRRFLPALNQCADMQPNIYYKQNTPYSGVYQAFQDIREVFHDQILMENQLIDVMNYRIRAIDYANSNLPEWEALFVQGRVDELILRADSMLGQMAASGNASQRALLALREDIMQLAYSVLSKNEITSHEMFLNKAYEEAYRSAANSISEMKRFVRIVLEKVQSSIRQSKKTTSAIELSLQYIHEHYAEDISREELASLVYLNPDYFAKIFKAQTGRSLGTYLWDLRIEKACSLLAVSDHPIGAIANEVGLSNFSYFSKVFKSTTGMSPKEYRARYNKDFSIDRGTSGDEQHEEK